METDIFNIWKNCLRNMLFFFRLFYSCSKNIFHILLFFSLRSLNLSFSRQCIASNFHLIAKSLNEYKTISQSIYLLITFSFRILFLLEQLKESENEKTGRFVLAWCKKRNLQVFASITGAILKAMNCTNSYTLLQCNCSFLLHSSFSVTIPLLFHAIFACFRC